MIPMAQSPTCWRLLIKEASHERVAPANDRRPEAPKPLSSHHRVLRDDGDALREVRRAATRAVRRGGRAPLPAAPACFESVVVFLQSSRGCLEVLLWHHAACWLAGGTDPLR